MKSGWLLFLGLGACGKSLFSQDPDSGFPNTQCTFSVQNLQKYNGELKVGKLLNFLGQDLEGHCGREVGADKAMEYFDEKLKLTCAGRSCTPEGK